MRLIGSICFAIVLGYLLGRWVPQNDLDHARKRVAELEEQVKKGGRGMGAGGLAGVGSLLRIPAEAPPVATASTSTPQRVEQADAAKPDPADAPRRDRRNLRERLNEARDIWDARSKLARDSFLGNLGAATPGVDSNAQARDFDVLVEAMNRKMAQRVEDWIGYIKQTGQVRPEDGARLMHAMTGAVVETYDEFDRKFPESWRAAAGKEFMLFDFVNPSVGEKFLEVEDILESSGRSF